MSPSNGHFNTRQDASFFTQLSAQFPSLADPLPQSTDEFVGDDGEVEAPPMEAVGARPESLQRDVHPPGLEVPERAAKNGNKFGLRGVKVSWMWSIKKGWQFQATSSNRKGGGIYAHAQMKNTNYLEHWPMTLIKNIPLYISSQLREIKLQNHSKDLWDMVVWLSLLCLLV